MPGTLVTGNELHDLPVSPHKEVGRYLDALELLKIGMPGMIQNVGEKTAQ